MTQAVPGTRSGGGGRLGAWQDLRPRLFGIAYRMLGTRADAEDAVQDAWVRLDGAEDPESLEAWAVTTVTRLCLDRLGSARARREVYVGPWLPEPILTSDTEDGPGRRAERSDALSVALLRVLERLEPVARAVFLLHDVFGYTYDEVAEIVGKTPVNCRQIARRARRRVRSARPRVEPDPAEHRRLLDGFIRATREGDVAGLEALLAEDVVMISDGGGKAPAARRPVRGANPVARFLVGVAGKGPADATMEQVELNGLPGMVVWAGGRPDTAISLDAADGRITAVYIVRNPEKLVGLAGGE